MDSKYIIKKSIFSLFLLAFISSVSAQEAVYPKSVTDAEKRLVYRMNIYDVPPAAGQGVRLAIYQSRDHVGSKQAMQDNFEQLEKALIEAKKYQVQLISFPELYLTGYSLDPKLAQQMAITKDSDYIKKVQALAKKYQMGIILPYAERAKDKKGKERVYDSIAFINAQGELLESYKKTHLFALAERLNWSAGNGPYNVYQINGFPVGILNCYEAEFPELQRILALKGAKLIVIPTAADNFYTKPSGKLTKIPYPDISKLLIPAAAYANNIFIAYSNRTGYEHLGKDKWLFQGNSVIADPYGKLLLAARHKQNTLLIADILPSAYGPTHPEDANYLRDRRPRLYNELIKIKVPFDGGYTYPAYPKGEYDYPGYKQYEESKQ
jgi:predicted amidohydrolase